MANSSWPPAKDLDFQTAANDFLAKITLLPATYGLVAADATALSPIVANMNVQMGLATDPATRTKVTVMAKRVSRAQTEAALRALARRVQSNNTVTAAAKTALGLPVHSLVPSPVPTPVTKPMLNIVNISNAQLTVRIVDESTPTKRAKAAGSIGAQVYGYVAAAGAIPPQDLGQWSFKGMATKADFQINYVTADAGKQAYVIARWLNSKGETGPNSLMINAPIAA